MKQSMCCYWKQGMQKNDNKLSESDIVRPHRVGFLLVPGFALMSYASAVEPLRAANVLSGRNLYRWRHVAIRSNDIARLTKIPGIGKKTAERMVLELRDKLPPLGADAVTAIPTLTAVEEDVLSALTNLGYQRAVAEKTVAGIAKSGQADSFEALFRGALGALSK